MFAHALLPPPLCSQMLWSATASALRLHLTHLRSPGAMAAGATHTALLRDIPGVSKGTLLDQVWQQQARPVQTHV
jgi:hypothetical protein